MEIDDKDLRWPAEHSGPQVGSPARSSIIAGWIIGGMFVVAILVRACAS